MRLLKRPLFASVMLAVLVVGGGTATALAAPGAAASPGRFTIDEAWCFQDGIGGYNYCFEMNGSMHVTTKPDGRETATINLRQATVIRQNGVVIGESRTTSLDQFRFSDEGMDIQTVAHTRSEFGGQKCVATTVLKIVDYEVVIDHNLAPICY
jgi:hypothetical protein